MARETATDSTTSGGETSHDDRGVDRTQIRQMLALTPLERLEHLEGFVESVLVIRALNEPTAVR